MARGKAAVVLSDRERDELAAVARRRDSSDYAL
jgi:hypothetical protein